MSQLNYDLLHYNALDGACTMECWKPIAKDIDPQGYRWAYDFTMSLYEPLMFMQTRGLKVDKDRLELMKTHINQKRQECEEELTRLCGYPLNANSPKQCQEYFYIKKGIHPYRNKEGGITTDDKAMQRIARGTAKHSGLREARLVQDIRGLVKLYGTYLDIDFDSDGRLRCAYNPRGTKFGRLSSSETVFGTGTNLQNLPDEFKGFIVADEGYFLWEVDKRQAEWVVVAYLAGDAQMIYVIENNVDPHTYTAHLMFGLPKEIIEHDKKILGNLSDPDEILERRTSAGFDKLIYQMPRTMSCRQMGKKSNHGLNYDEGYNTFALSNEIEIPESKRVINLYHQIYPNIRNVWYPSVKRQLADNRSITNCFGRKIRFLDAWGDDLFKAAYSAVPQSTVGDNTNQGMRCLYEDDELCSKAGANMDLLANVHDSLLNQVPFFNLDRDMDKLVQRVYTHMEPQLEYNGRQFKIATDSKFGLNWGAYHPDKNPQGMKEIDTTKPGWIEELRAHLGRQGA